MPPAMNIPSLQERKEFWSWGYANCAFEQVVEGCEFVSNAPTPIPDVVQRLLVAGIITTYARPFTRTDGAHIIPKSIVPKEYLPLHQRIMDIRHKVIAHVDAQKFQADDKKFGNINQVRITVRNGQNNLVAISADSTALPVPEIKQLALRLLEKAEYHVGKFRRKYIHSVRLADGEFKLSLDPNTQTPFIKIAALARKD